MQSKNFPEAIMMQNIKYVYHNKWTENIQVS